MVEAGKYFCYSLLTASNLELTRVVIKRIIIKHHPTGYRNTNTEIILCQIFFSVKHRSPKLIVDCLILAHPDSWHLLQHSLPTKCLETIYFQLWIPEILECFWRLIHLLSQIILILLLQLNSHIFWSSSVLIPFHSSFVDHKSWFQPHHSKVHVDHHWLK